VTDAVKLGLSEQDREVEVAAGPRFLNSYDSHCKHPLFLAVAAGPRFLNSYNEDLEHVAVNWPHILLP
jgi:hypothetical protein